MDDGKSAPNTTTDSTLLVTGRDLYFQGEDSKSIATLIGAYLYFQGVEPDVDRQREALYYLALAFGTRDTNRNVQTRADWRLAVGALRALEGLTNADSPSRKPYLENLLSCQLTLIEKGWSKLHYEFPKALGALESYEAWALEFDTFLDHAIIRVYTGASIYFNTADSVDKANGMREMAAGITEILLAPTISDKGVVDPALYNFRTVEAHLMAVEVYQDSEDTNKATLHLRNATKAIETSPSPLLLMPRLEKLRNGSAPAPDKQQQVDASSSESTGSQEP